MTWYETIIAAHTAVTNAVSHGQRMKSDRYFVWQEDGANDLEANGAHTEKAMQGTTDLFSKTEFDPWADALGESLSSHDIAWYLNDVGFEEETGFWHWEWVWEVAYG